MQRRSMIDIDAIAVNECAKAQSIAVHQYAEPWHTLVKVSNIIT